MAKDMMMNVIKVVLESDTKTGMDMDERETGALETMTGMVAMGITTVVTGIGMVEIMGIDMLEIMRGAMAEMVIGMMILGGEVQAWMTIIMVLEVEALIEIEIVHMMTMVNILLGMVSFYFDVSISQAEYQIYSKVY